MKEGAGPTTRSAKMAETDGASAVGKQEKKRPRSESDAESGEDQNVGLGVPQRGNGSVDQKRKRTASSEAEKKRQIDRKKEGAGRFRKGGRIDKRRVREEPSSEEDPYEFKEDVEISKRKPKKGSLKFGKDEIGRKRSRGGSIKVTKAPEIDRKKVKVAKSKGHEGEVEKKGALALGSKNAGSAAGPDEECSGSSEVEKGTPSNLHISSGSVVERSKGADWFDKKVFSVERVNDFRLVGISTDKHSPSSRKANRKQGKDGDSKVLSNGERKVGGTPAKHNRTETEDSRKHPGSPSVVPERKAMFTPSFSGRKKLPEETETEDSRKHPGSSSVPDKKAMFTPSFSGRKKLPEESGSAVTVTKNQKTGERKVRDVETEDLGVSSRAGSKNRGANSTSMTEVKNEGASPLILEGSLPDSEKEAGEEMVPGTEKQLLRAQIKTMLLDAGWTIDYRPRRNHNYSDSVYICPTGGSYWSIVKAYRAFREQQNSNDEGNGRLSPQKLKRGSGALSGSNCKRKGRGPLFSPLPTKAIGLLMRKTSEATNKYKNVTQEGKRGKGRVEENSSAGFRTKGLVGIFKSKKLIDEDSGEMGKKHKGCALLVRSSNNEAITGTDGPYARKRTVLSWMIDSGTVPLNAKVQYMNRRHTHAMLDGRVTRDGIHCNCCSKILTVSDFEVHAGSKLNQPFQNIILDAGISLLQCQLEAWGKQEESKRCGFHSIDVDGDDPDDDTCGICGDGGDLLCCDSCPSTFHQSCLNMEKLPQDDWYCPNCTCKFCGLSGDNVSQSDDTPVSPLLSCSQCEEKYHLSCIQETDAVPVPSRRTSTSFCSHNCRKLIQKLHKLLGVKNDLEGGFSWTLIQRFEDDSKTPSRSLSQRADCNSKLAVALAVMDECFLPIIDRRSGINVIHNALYNFGSNFNRLNYCGFYTAILERDDEIISAASIRIHGTRLAEMPFIGTRHMYRRQGMCRRLLTAIEMALCSLNVEKLIIPAVSELMHTWTVVFGFKPLEESHRQEMRSMNMVVFPGTDLLQKQLLNFDSLEGTTTADAAITTSEITSNNVDAPEVENASISESSLDAHQHEFDAGEVKDKVAASKPCHQSCGSSAANVMLESSDVPNGSSSQNCDEGTVCDKSEPRDKSMESASDAAIDVVELETNNDTTPKVENASLAESSVDVHLHNSDIEQVKDTVAASELCHKTCGVSAAQMMLKSLDFPIGSSSQNYGEATVCDKSEPLDKSLESTSDAATGAVELDSNNDDALKVENASLAESSVDVHLHVSDIGEVKDKVVDSEPCHQTCGTSACQMMLESLDVPNESSSQNYGEGTVCDKFEPQDKSMESASDAATGAVELESNNDAEPKVENASLAESSVDVHLHDSDASEVKDKVAASEPCHQTCGVSASQMMLESLDVPDGSSSQNYGGETVCDKSDPQDKCMESAFDAATGVVELESNNAVAPEVENASLAESSVDVHLHDSDIGEVKDKVGASEPCNQTSGVSASQLMLESLDVRNGSNSQTSGDGAVHDKSEDSSMNSASDAAVGGVELESNNDVSPQVENAPLAEFSVDAHLHDCDIGEVKDNVAVSEPCHQTFWVSAAKVVVVESLYIPSGSSSQTYGEGTVCDKSELQDKSVESASEAVVAVELESNNDCTPKAENASLVESSIGYHQHDSHIGELKDKAAASEPCHHRCGVSVAEVMLESLDIPNASSSQTYVEGTVCDKFEPQDKFMETASDAAIGAVELDSNNDDAAKVENAYLSESFMDAHLHDFDMGAVKGKVAASEPSPQTCGASAGKVMLESLDVPIGSDSQTYGEGTVCDKCEPWEKPMESASNAAIDSIEIESNNDDAPNVENASLAESSVDVHLHDSDIREVKDKVATSEPCNQTCGVSASQMMLESLDVPNGSSSLTCGEGTVRDISEPQDMSMEFASYAAIGAVGLERNNDDATEVENAPLAVSSVDAHLHDSDIGEVKVRVGTSEPCHQTCGASAAKVMVESIDVPSGSSSQTYGEGTICDNSEPQDKSVESVSDAAVGAVELESNKDDTPKAENAPLAESSICAHQYDSHIGEVKDKVAASEPCCHRFEVSAAEVMLASLDVPNSSTSQSYGDGTVCDMSQDKSMEYASDKGFLHHAGTRTFVENYSPVGPDQFSGDGELSSAHNICQSNVEVCRVESDLHALCKTCVQHTSEVINDARSSFEASGESISDMSQSTTAPLNPSSHGFGENVTHNGHEVKVATVEPNACSFDKRPIHALDTASGCNIQTSCESAMQHSREIITQSLCNSSVHSFPPSGECSGQQNNELVSKPLKHISGAALVLSSDVGHHDKTDVPNRSLLSTPDEPNLCPSSEVTVRGTCEVNSDITYIEHDSHSLGRASVYCTSEVACVSLNAASGSECLFFDKGRRFDVVCKPSDSSVTSSHDLDVDSHNTSIVACQSGGDLPATSNHHVSVDGTVPDIHEVKSVERDHHGPLDASICHNTSTVASQSEIDIAAASRHDAEGSIPNIQSVRVVEPDHNGSVDASVCHDTSAVGSKSGGDFPTALEHQVSTEVIMSDISGRGSIQLDDHGSLDASSSHNALAVSSESGGDCPTASRHHVSAEGIILDIQGTESVKPDHHGSVGAFVCHRTSAIASESGGDFPTGSSHHTSSEGSIPDIHVIESVEAVCNGSVDASSFHKDNNTSDVASQCGGDFLTASGHHMSCEGTMPDIQGIESVELDHHGSADTSLYHIDDVVASESGGDFPAASTSAGSSEGTVPDIHRVESVELDHQDSVNASVCHNTCAVASESGGNFHAASNHLVSSEGTISDIQGIESVESNDQYSVDASVCHITSSIASEYARHSPASMHRLSPGSTNPDTQEIESVETTC